MVDDAFINTSDDDYLNTQDDQWDSIIDLDVFSSFHSNYVSDISIIVNKGLERKSVVHDHYSRYVNITGLLNKLLSLLNSYHGNNSSILDLYVTLDVDDRWVNTEDDQWVNTEDDQWYAITSTLEILNSYHGNYDSSINLNLYQILQLLSTYHDNNLTIINNRLLQILTSYRVYHDHSSSKFGLLPRGLLLTPKKMVHDHYTRSLLKLAYGYSLIVFRALHENNSSILSLYRDRKLELFNSVLSLYTSILNISYYKVLELLSTVHSNNSIDVDNLLSKILDTNNTVHDDLTRKLNVFLSGLADLFVSDVYHDHTTFDISLLLSKIFNIISNVLDIHSNKKTLSTDRGVNVDSIVHDNLINEPNIILRDLFITVINSTNDLLSRFVNTKLNKKVFIQNTLNDILLSNVDLDIQVATTISLIILDSIIGQYTNNNVLSVQEITALYNFIAKNIRYFFIAKESEDI